MLWYLMNLEFLYTHEFGSNGPCDDEFSAVNKNDDIYVSDQYKRIFCNCKLLIKTYQIVQ